MIPVIAGAFETIGNLEKSPKEQKSKIWERLNQSTVCPRYWESAALR